VDNILIIASPATPEQIAVMLSVHRFYIKLAIDINRGILAGGGELHADCEVVLLEAGSQQANVWGASWNPSTREVFYESLINIRPRQNRSMEILDPDIRLQVIQIIDHLLGAV